MTRESGLTLLEVIVALVIVSALAASSLPLLTEANRVLRAPKEAVATFDLARAVDLLFAEPAKHGVAKLPDDCAITWPEHPERDPIRVRRLRAEKSDHSWLAFTWKGLSVTRFEPIEGKR